MRKSSTIIQIVLLCCCTPLLGQTNRWKLVTTIPEVDLHNVQVTFADSLHGYLFGWKPLKFGSPTYEDPVLYRTIDGGMTWQNIDFRTILGKDSTWYGIQSGNHTFFRFDVASANSCVVSNAGQGSAPEYDSLTFYWSRNNGTSWSRTRTVPGTARNVYSIEAAPYDHQIVALKVNNYIPGWPESGQFNVSATNGAVFDDIRWDSILLNNISTNRGVSVADHTFDFFDDVTWIVTVSDKNNFGGIKRPFTLVTLLAKDLDSDADPGTYWEEYPNIIPDFPSDPDAKYFDSHCIRGTEYVYLFSGYGGEGQYPFYGINYLYSSDQGRSWNADSSFVVSGESHRRAITASAPSEVWSTVIPLASTIFPNSPATWITHSSDFGKTWSIDSLSLHVNEHQYYDGRTLSFSDINHGWMLAQSDDGQNSAIFRYVGTTSAVHDISKNTRSSFSIYPNPAGDEIMVRSEDDIPITCISICDILGREWQYHGEDNDGSSPVKIHIKEMPSGSYVARIKNKKGSETLPFFVKH